MELGQRNLSLPPPRRPGPPGPGVPLRSRAPRTAGQSPSPVRSSSPQPWGRGRGPGIKPFLRARLPPPSAPAPPSSPEGGGAPLRSSGWPPLSSGLGSLPCSKHLSPGSILSRRSGEGAAVGGAPTRSLSPPDGRRGLRGAPGGPGRPRAARPGRSTLPCAPRAAGLGRSHQPRRDGAGRDWAGRAGAGRRRRAPAPPSSAGGVRVRQSSGPRAPAASRGRVGTARMLFPTTPTPSRTRWLLPRFLACRFNPFLATRRRERLFYPLPPGPLPSSEDPEECVRSPLQRRASREIPYRGGAAVHGNPVGLSGSPLPVIPEEMGWAPGPPPPPRGVPGAKVQASKISLPWERVKAP